MIHIFILSSLHSVHFSTPLYRPSPFLDAATSKKFTTREHYEPGTPQHVTSGCFPQRCFVFPLTSTSSSEADLESRPQCEYKAFPEVNNETTLKQGEPGTLQFEKWANASELKLLCLKASINETWLRVRGPSCSSPLTIGLFFCQPGRGDSSGNGFLKQLEGGQRVMWQQPRANQQPQTVQQSADCLILDNPDSPTALFTTSPPLQSDICGSRADILCFFLQALDEIMIKGCKVKPLLLHLFYLQLTFWHWSSSTDVNVPSTSATIYHCSKAGTANKSVYLQENATKCWCPNASCCHSTLFTTWGQQDEQDIFVQITNYSSLHVDSSNKKKSGE